MTKIALVEESARLRGQGISVTRELDAPAAALAGAPVDDVQNLLRDIDRHVHAQLGQWYGGVSLIGLSLAWGDWLRHLSISPGKQTELAWKAADKWRRVSLALAQCLSAGGRAECIAPLRQDRRFEAPEWQAFPFNIIYQSFLLTQQWWHNATTSVVGVADRNEKLVEFYSRQLLDMFSPSNFIATNPVLLNRTIEEGGQNLVRGLSFMLEDLSRSVTGERPATSGQFMPGRKVAITPGRVVFRNELIELIQYEPVTPTVEAQPVLLVPAWIMKYYILDLSPENSFIRNLVAQGFTVFCISWKNPDQGDRDLSLEDYRRSGVMAALDAVQIIAGARSVHAAGYCLGGTLLAIAAATMAREGDDRFASLSFFAAQADFDEAGELSLFVNENQLALTEDMMWRDGFLDQRRLAGAFRVLRSQDLIWSAMVKQYMMGERPPVTDIEAWSTDATRMPYRMHSEYLRKLFLNNDLAEGRFQAGGDTVLLRDIKAPAFVMATERDHIAPWRSVFKFTYMLTSNVTFCIASGGHNTGVVAPPGAPNHSYHMPANGKKIHEGNPEEWFARAPKLEGSWWGAWVQWLREHSTGERRPPPSMGNPAGGLPPLAQAPGAYVLAP